MILLTLVILAGLVACFFIIRAVPPRAPLPVRVEDQAVRASLLRDHLPPMEGDDR